MADPYLGEIRLFAFPFAPSGWAICDGSMLPVSQNQALYTIIGNYYGGNITNFALPDLRGRTAVHTDGNHLNPGQIQGEENCTLTIEEMPLHNHQARASSQPSNSTDPVGHYWANSTANPYGTQSPQASAAPSLAASGASQGHPNMQPYTVINYCIALSGIYPPRN